MVYFNSHPHEEDDVAYLELDSSKFQISTHILTKRMTWCNFRANNKVIFQLTSSRRGWQERIKSVPFCFYISTHILTKRMTSHGWMCFKNVKYFNSHPHEEDDLDGSAELKTYILFQLTSSRRGWPVIIFLTTWSGTFQLTSSRRGWRSPCTCAFMLILSFQLTSSRRGWPFTGCCDKFTETFQLTSSRRGWQQF